MKIGAWVSLAAALGLGGCELAPLYQTPVVALPAHFDNASGSSSEDALLSSQWWRTFRDPTLDRLEADLEAANPDLKAAYAAYEVAQARAQVATAGLFPEVDFAGELSANKQSANRPLRSKSQPTYYGANQIGAEVASYELDVWGRVADLVKAANADAQASADALANARLLLQGELARDYVDLRSLDAEARLLADTIKLYQNALDLTQQRLKANIAPPIDAQRATSQLATIKAQATALSVRRVQLVDAIATLAGRAAPGFSLAPISAPMTLPRRPNAAPGELLRRRPDVALAERQFASANELIGVARANMYPRFTIGLLAGSQDTSIRFFDPANTLYSIGPSVSVPLFDADRRQNEVKEARAQAKGAAEHYRATVLNAVREVQDGVSALRYLAEESSQSQIAQSAALKALQMSDALYRDGAASFLDVVTAQDAALLAERAAIGARASEMDAYVGLLMALGGGWSLPPHQRGAPKLAEANPLSHAPSRTDPSATATR